MKFLVFFALVAVATAFPAEEALREKRQVLLGSHGLVLANPGLIGARTIIASPLAAPLAPAIIARSGTTLVSPTSISGGAVLTPDTSVVGPSPLGTVGVVASNGLAWI